jgi:hypothetical protein
MQIRRDRRASAVCLIAPSPYSAAENIFTFRAFSMRCRQENLRMPFFSTPRASMAMPRAHANSGERKTLRALGRLLPARQSPRTFPRFFAFSMGCRQENFPCRPLRAPRADGGAAGACKSRGERRASAPSFGCSQPVLGRRENFHVLRLFNALRAGKIRAPFSEPRPAMPRAAVVGLGRDLARSRFSDGCGRRRTRIASHRKGTNRILRPNLDEEYDNTDCVLRNDKTHNFRKRQLNHRHRLTAFSPRVRGNNLCDARM